jgi:hypothetical protein
MNCQGYVHHLAQGKWTREWKNPGGRSFGEFWANLLPACEASCNRIKVDEQPVAIRDLKRFPSAG